MIMEFTKGLIVGFCASIPLGPIGVLCIQRTLSKGRNSGLITGMGAATTDLILAAISLFSLTFINDIINEYVNVAMIIGGAIIGGFGIRLITKNPITQIKRVQDGSKQYIQDFFSTFIMTITNPGAFFLMFSLLAFMGLNSTEESGGFSSIALTLLGVFSGGTAWWYIFSTGVNKFRNRLRLRQIVMINRVSGIIILILGLCTLIQGIYELTI